MKIKCRIDEFDYRIHKFKSKHSLCKPKTSCLNGFDEISLNSYEIILLWELS